MIFVISLPQASEWKMSSSMFQSLIFTCKAKITGFTVQNGWYYLACPTCSKALRLDHNAGKLCCQYHGEQIGHPMYKLELRLEDEEDSTTATIIGRTADSLFGITCEELVNNQGEDDKYNLPPAIERTKEQYHVWRIGYGIRNDFMVKDVYPDTGKSEEDNAYPDTGDSEGVLADTSEPKLHTPAKRSIARGEEATLKELLNLEMSKK